MITLAGNKATLCGVCLNGAGECWHAPSKTVTVTLTPAEVLRIRSHRNSVPNSIRGEILQRIAQELTRR